MQTGDAYSTFFGRLCLFSLLSCQVLIWSLGSERCGASNAARGVDGISHHDLLALPDAWTERLLELLGNIELLTAGHILGGCQRDC